MSDLSRKKYTLEVAGREMSLEVSKIGEQANAAVIGTYGDTQVLVTVVMGKEDKEIDFMPLTVDYEEKFYAAGKIMGGKMMRREGKAPDGAVLSGRLVDRTIRPLFDHRIRRDIHVVVTTLSYDEENGLDLISLITASAAIAISDIPWNGPVAGVKVAKIGNEFVVNPSVIQLNGESIEFETFIAGVNGRVNMIELDGDDAKEKDIVNAFKIASGEIEKIVEWQKKIIKEIGKPKTDIALFKPDEALEKAVKEFLNGKLETALYVEEKIERQDNIENLRADMLTHLVSIELDKPIHANYIFDNEIDEVVHKNVIESDKRPDGRALDEIRDLYAEVGTLRRAHGSALFTRGNTQALVVTTLGAPGDAQRIETVENRGEKRFMLHYNFPRYSVGETGSFRGPGRRDIGHGALAEKTIKPLIPKKEDFPYTIRVVSEILSSNGSSSMATVCGASLSLMDAGVPIKKPAAGIAMGLMTHGEKFKVLTDIQGPEDHYGDMDLKVAGTKDGVNAIQMDVKIEGVTFEILEKALEQAKKARLEILGFVDKVLDKPREELSQFAPRILTTSIDPSRIGEVIGPGGKVINGIRMKTGVASIDIDDDGKIFISGDMVSAEAALKEINLIVKGFEVGDIVEGPIVRILDFGAIVDLGGGKDGMIHVSELKDGFVKNVQDVVKIGDEVTAKVIKSEAGKIGLSLRQVK